MVGEEDADAPGVTQINKKTEKWLLQPTGILKNICTHTTFKNESTARFKYRARVPEDATTVVEEKKNQDFSSLDSNRPKRRWPQTSLRHSDELVQLLWSVRLRVRARAPARPQHQHLSRKPGPKHGERRQQPRCEAPSLKILEKGDEQAAAAAAALVLEKQQLRVARTRRRARRRL